MKIKIDEEFKNLIPPLSAESFKQLEENIISDGCRDALIVEEDGTLIDGHNRYSICTKHEIHYKTEIKHFDSREDIIIFICKNQSGRRNLSEEQLSYLRGKEYEAEKKKIGNASGVNQYSEVRGQNDPKPNRSHDTAKRIGKEHAVGEATIRRDARFAKAVDTISEASQKVKQNILSGAINAPKKKIIEIAEKPEPERNTIVKQLEQGKPVSEVLPKKQETIPEPTTAEIVQQIHHPELAPEFTIDNLTDEIHENGEEFAHTMKNVIATRSTLLTSTENRQKVLKSLDGIISQIEKLKEIVK